LSDIDGDNDLDILINGSISAVDESTKLYRNDGNGNFTEDFQQNFIDVTNGSTLFFDFDGDNDEDVIIAGSINSGTRITKLYNNDGQGNFTEMNNSNIIGVSASSMDYSDIDGDNDFDLIVAGLENTFRTALYVNDGFGNFSENTAVPFVDVSRCSVAFFDADGDNDSDIIISGNNGSSTSVTKLYYNDGLGNFSEAINENFIGVENGSV
jgi:hypothetical protein